MANGSALRESAGFGALRGPDNSRGGVDARPVAVKNFLAAQALIAPANRGTPGEYW
jgi:hypothetical protein